jgi:hypothetical protein
MVSRSRLQSKTQSSLSGIRWKATLASLAIIVPAGFYSKFYRGPGAHWVNDSLDGVFYEVFWCLLLSLVLPRTEPRTLAGGVLAATCVLEFLQLWHPVFLEVLRSTFLGATILGATFDWSDFPYYFAGSGIGWFWLNRLRSRKASAR